MGNREFSLYDIEQFLREAGAEKVNEKAVLSLEKELENTVKELLAEASVYANYAGRKRIKRSDIVMLHRNDLKSAGQTRKYSRIIRHRLRHKHGRNIGLQKRAAIEAMVCASMPRAAQGTSL